MWLRRFFEGAPSTKAACVLATDTWALTLPANWKAEPDSPPLRALGPDEVVLTISPALVSGGESGPELEAIVQEVESNALRSIAATQAQPGLSVRTPLTRELLPNGSVLHGSQAIEDSTGYFIAQYSLRRGRTVLLATHEGPSTGVATLAIVSAALRSIVWGVDPVTA